MLLVPLTFLICFGAYVCAAVAAIPTVFAFAFAPSVLGWLSAWRDRKNPKIDRNVADQDRVTVQIGTSNVSTYQPIRLRVLFYRDDLNASEAIHDITPVWDFGHDNLTTEEGWDVVHYFPRQRSYLVKVKFQHHSGDFLRVPVDPTAEPGTLPQTTKRPAGAMVFAKRIIKVSSVRSGGSGSFFLEAFRMLVAIVPALLSLYAGAVENLDKLDFISALIAVFLLGFTSDQVKNLLT